MGGELFGAYIWYMMSSSCILDGSGYGWPEVDLVFGLKGVGRVDQGGSEEPNSTAYVTFPQLLPTINATPAFYP